MLAVVALVDVAAVGVATAVAGADDVGAVIGGAVSDDGDPHVSFWWWFREDGVEEGGSDLHPS